MNVPTRPHHFITGKTLLMLIIFVGVALFALGSYFYLLAKPVTKVPPIIETSTNDPLSPKRPVLQNPRRYSDEKIVFDYPETLILDEASSSAITWKYKSENNTLTPGALILTKSTNPFTEPQDTKNNPLFSIDDEQKRNLNGIESIEYTIDCGYRCGFREEQFLVGKTYYRLRFDTGQPGFSDQAERILETLKLVVPSPTAPQSVCTQEAKLCPDGSYVGRQGPNCAFAACPE